MVLLPSMTLRLVNIECMPSSTKFNAVIDLDVDIADLLPYLAAEIRGCTYVDGNNELTYMQQGHIIALRARQITVTAVEDEAEAWKICNDLKTLVNDVHQRRNSIHPVRRKHARLGPLAVYQHLPGTNCGDCGEPTCMAFAASVVTRTLPIKRCAPLLQGTYEESRRLLWRLLSEAEYELD